MSILFARVMVGLLSIYRFHRLITLSLYSRTRWTSGTRKCFNSQCFNFVLRSPDCSRISASYEETWTLLSSLPNAGAFLILIICIVT